MRAQLFTAECYAAEVSVRMSARGALEVSVTERGDRSDRWRVNLVQLPEGASEDEVLRELNEALTRVILAIPERVAQGRERLAWLRSDRRGLLAKSNVRLVASDAAAAGAQPATTRGPQRAR